MGTICDCYLHQHNGNNELSLIDLIFTEAMQVSDIAHHTSLGKRNHNVITFKCNCYLYYSKPKDKYAYKHANFKAMWRDLMGTNWQEKFITFGVILEEN